MEYVVSFDTGVVKGPWAICVLKISGESKG